MGSPSGVQVTFWGVRGSTPCAGAQYSRYGGHSSCVSVEAPGQAPVVFDMGTGLTPYGEARGGADQPFRGTVLLTHLHWDHVQGLPFFTPLHHERARMDVYGPAGSGEPGQGLGQVFDGLMRPPFFPINYGQLPGDVHWHDTTDDTFAVGNGAKVKSRLVPHVGPTLGFRVDWEGASVAYVSDHCQGCGGATNDDYVPDAVLELCDGVDLLIHDAQHTGGEFDQKRSWGHCTHDYALHVARAAGARRLALFHHCPTHGDAMIDQMLAEAADAAARGTHGPEVLAAAEGLVVELGAHR